MQPSQFDMRRLFLAITLVAFGIWMMNFPTAYRSLFLLGSIIVGASFGAAVGLILNRLKPCVWIGMLGFVSFAIFAILC
jgi:hypothetical protein